MLTLARSDTVRLDVYTPQGRNWFTFGDTVFGDVVVSLRKPRAVGKVAARIRCIQKVRLPQDKTSNSLQFRTDTRECYDGIAITALDMGGHTGAAGVHRHPVNFTLPSDSKDLLPSSTYWSTFKGKKEWYGVKWVLEPTESNASFRCEEQEIIVLPKGTIQSLKPTNLRTAEKSLLVKLPSPGESPNNLQRMFQVMKRDHCTIRIGMESPSLIYAGQLPHLHLTTSCDLDDAAVLFKVRLSLRSRIKTSVDNCTHIIQNKKILAKWYPDAQLSGEVDISDEFRANLREEALWECDSKNDLVAVTHFLDYKVIILGKWDRGYGEKLEITCPIKIAAPLVCGPGKDVLPRYSA